MACGSLHSTSAENISPSKTCAPHDGGQLTGGIVEGEEIICPRHGAGFCIRTGAALSAPAYEPTVKFLVRVENGEIQVRDDRWD